MIGLGADLLIGYVYNDKGEICKQENIKLTAEQISAFIMKYRNATAVVITNVMDITEIEVSYGLINRCIDQEFLLRELIPTLTPMQRGDIEAAEFKPYDSASNI